MTLPYFASTIRTGEVVSPVRKSPDQQECLPPLKLLIILKHDKTMIGFNDTMPIGAMTIGDLKFMIVIKKEVNVL